MAAALNRFSSSQQNNVQLENSFMRIHDKVIRWQDMILSVSKIERVWYTFEFFPFPKAALFLVLVGIFFTALLPPAGLVLLAIGAVWLFYWYQKKQKAKMIIIFDLSHYRFEFRISDHQAGHQVVDAVEAAMCETPVAVNVDLGRGVEFDEKSSSLVAKAAGRS